MYNTRTSLALGRDVSAAGTARTCLPASLATLVCRGGTSLSAQERERERREREQSLLAAPLSTVGDYTINMTKL